MKHQEIVVSAALFGVAAALFGGCGDDGSTTGQGGATSASSAAQSSSDVASASSSAMSSSSSGTPGDGNDTCETGDPLGVDDSIDTELEPTGDVDHFQFEGKEGQYLWIDTDAESYGGVQYDPAYIDTRVTLYDSSGQQIAQNNDLIPSYNADSRLYTRLPADGTYCVRVEDCWTWSKDPANDCGGTADKDNTGYSLYITELDPALEGFIVDPEKGNDAVGAEPIEYRKANGGGYYTSEIYGTFTDKNDIDVFSFTLPADIVSSPGTRPEGEFFLLDAGKNGTGSTTPVGRAYITTAADPQTVLHEVYASQNNEIFAPLTPGTPYLLFLYHPNVAGDANDFYFVRHYGTYGNPLEAAEPMNDAVATAEALTLKSSGSGFRAFIEGDLPAAGPDVDHFKVTVPAQFVGNGTLSITCGALRDGSGLRDLTIALFDGAGSSIAIDAVAAVETGTKYARVINEPLPAGVTDLVYKLTASQDAVVTSSFYRCGLYLNP